MTKNEYISALGRELKRLGVPDAGDVLEEYEQHFAFKGADGRTEEEIAALRRAGRGGRAVCRAGGGLRLRRAGSACQQQAGAQQRGQQPFCHPIFHASFPPSQRNELSRCEPHSGGAAL